MLLLYELSCASFGWLVGRSVIITSFNGSKDSLPFTHSLINHFTVHSVWSLSKYQLLLLVWTDRPKKNDHSVVNIVWYAYTVLDMLMIDYGWGCITFKAPCVCVCEFIIVCVCVCCQCVRKILARCIGVGVYMCVCVVSVWEKSLHVVLGKKKIEQEKVTPTNKKG